MYMTNGQNSVAVNGVNEFQAANPAAGVPNGTELTYNWFNDVQGELLNVLAAAGVPQAQNTPTQVLEAIKRLFGGNRLLVTASGTLSADNAGLVVINAAAGPVTMTLPAAAGAGGAPLKFIFIRTDTSTNAVTVQDAGSDTDAPGDATSEPVLAGSPLWIESDGVSVWDVILQSEALAFQALAPTASATITPVALRTVVTPNLGGPATLTIEPGSFQGQEEVVYGGAFAVTVSSSASTGSPYFGLPDGTQVYSWVIPAAAVDSGIRLIWDGANWRCTTFGQTIVAPGVAANQAVQMGQFTSGGSTAMAFFASNAAAGTIGSSGWYKEPDGRIVNWATIQLQDSTEIKWTFSLSFASGVRGMKGTNFNYAAGQGGGYSDGALVCGYVPTNSYIQMMLHNTSASGTLCAFYVEAWGY